MGGGGKDEHVGIKSKGRGTVYMQYTNELQICKGERGLGKLRLPRGIKVDHVCTLQNFNSHLCVHAKKV